MKRSQYRLLQVGVFALTVLFGATACSKHKADESQIDTEAASVPEQTQASDVQASQPQDGEKHSVDYYKTDNKQRVDEENGLLDDVNSKK